MGQVRGSAHLLLGFRCQYASTIKRGLIEIAGVSVNPKSASQTGCSRSSRYSRCVSRLQNDFLVISPALTVASSRDRERYNVRRIFP